MSGIDRNLGIIYNDCSEKITSKSFIFRVFRLLAFQEGSFFRGLEIPVNMMKSYTHTHLQLL